MGRWGDNPGSAKRDCPELAGGPRAQGFMGSSLAPLWGLSQGRRGAVFSLSTNRGLQSTHSRELGTPDAHSPSRSHRVGWGVPGRGCSTASQPGVGRGLLTSHPQHPRPPCIFLPGRPGGPQCPRCPPTGLMLGLTWAGVCGAGGGPQPGERRRDVCLTHPSLGILIAP